MNIYRWICSSFGEEVKLEMAHQTVPCYFDLNHSTKAAARVVMTVGKK